MLHRGRWGIVAVLACVAITALGISRLSLQPPDQSELPEPNIDPISAFLADGPTAHLPLRFLVIGLDASMKRSDVLLAVSIPEQGKVDILSIPRDTQVIRRDGRRRKINEIYASEGIDSTREVVAELLGVEYPYSVVLSFAGFERLVDALDGVPILVENRMHYVDRAGGLVIDIDPGYQKLTGSKALDFVRYRADGRGDIGRIARQQDFMRAWAKTIATDPTRLLALSRELPSGVQTDLPVTQSLRLALRLATGKHHLNFSVLPGEGMYVEGVSYWLPR